MQRWSGRRGRRGKFRPRRVVDAVERERKAALMLRPERPGSAEAEAWWRVYGPDSLPQFDEVSPELQATLLAWGTAQAVWPDGRRCWAQRRGDRVVIFLEKPEASYAERCFFIMGNWLRAGLWPEREEPSVPRWWRGWDPTRRVEPSRIWRNFADPPRLWEVSRPLQELLRRDRTALGETADGMEYRANLWRGRVEFTGPDPVLPEPEPYYPDPEMRPIIQEEPAGVVWRSWWRN